MRFYEVVTPLRTQLAELSDKNGSLTEQADRHRTQMKALMEVPHIQKLVLHLCVAVCHSSSWVNMFWSYSLYLIRWTLYVSVELRGGAAATCWAGVEEPESDPGTGRYQTADPWRGLPPRELSKHQTVCVCVCVCFCRSERNKWMNWVVKGGQTFILFNQLLRNSMSGI